MSEAAPATKFPETNTPSPSGQDAYDEAVRKARTLPGKQNAPLDPKLIENYIPEATKSIVDESNKGKV